MFSADIVIALMIFIFILMSIAWVWDFSTEKIRLDERRNNMNLISMQSLTSLIQTRGEPADWHFLPEEEFNASNVASLGLVGTTLSAWELDEYKIKKLYEYNQTKYETVKEMLGLRGSGYDFSIKLSKVGGFILPGFLGDKKIAYTYADGDPLEGNESNFGIRQYLIDSNIPFVNYDEDWQSLLNDIDNYDALVFEDPQLRVSDLSAEQQQILENWVIDGGTYLQKQFGRIIELFNVTTNNVAHEWGTVIAIDGMLANVVVGDSVYVIEGYRISKQGPITKLVHHDSSEHMLVGYWNYGEGRVYYFPDTEGQIYNLTGGIMYNNTRVLLNLPQNKPTLVFGKEPLANASNIVVVSRLATVGQFYVNVSLTLWEHCTWRCT